jgi:penicillin-binding protein 1A
MHPNLVAGAWVGFNDSRVTMRSDHWGQGGHNALLLVGDFFRDTLKTKLINVKAKFPQPKRPPPLMVQAPGNAENVDVVLPSGYGVINSNDDGISRADELGRYLSGLGDGQNAVPGQESSSGASGAHGDAQAGGLFSDYGE